MSWFWFVHRSGNANRNMLRLKKCLHPFRAEFATPPALLDAPERRLAGRRQAIVDADNPSFERFGQAKHSGQIAREGVRAQPVRRMVRSLDRLSLSFEGANGRDGSERFLLHAQRALGGIGEHRWLKKVPGSRQRLSAA